MEFIRVRGARTHNLKNVDLDLPRGRLVVITGISGSGKSSLAFDTLYAEGQRRYVESLSAYARQFLHLMEKPDVDLVEGLSPAIAIEQKAAGHNPRSTVGTITEIHDYLRLLFARVGEPRCPTHGIALQARTVSQVVDTVLAFPPDVRIMVLAPVLSGRKGEHRELIEDLRAQGFVRIRLDGQLQDLDPPPKLVKSRHHDIEVVIDRLRAREDSRQRLAESVETAMRLGNGRVLVVDTDNGVEHAYSSRYACPHCDYSAPDLEPRLFSFNNPAGACPECDGLGHVSFFDPDKVVAFPHQSLAAGAIKGWDRRNQFYHQMLESLASHAGFDLDAPFQNLPEAAKRLVLRGSGREKIRFVYIGEKGNQYTREHAFEGIIPNIERRYRETESPLVREELARYMTASDCEACGGARLRPEARYVFVGDRTLPEVERLALDDCLSFFQDLRLDGTREAIGSRVLHEIRTRIRFLVSVGLNYLSLDRSADTLSGGEAQRIRLASQIGTGLTGVMYVLDEPSIGLHQRDNDRLLETLERLRDLGNSVLVVEHDLDAILRADHVVDMGPGAGVHGGRVVASGTPEEIALSDASITGCYLSGVRRIPVPETVHGPDWEQSLEIRNARGNNLKHVNAKIPLGLFVCVTGVSGSGKSTLVNDTLFLGAAQHLHGSQENPAEHDEIVGLEKIDKVVNVDQSPIGRTPRSNPATYTGLLTPIRELFAGVPLSRERGYGPGRFSFNVKGGRCEACQGDGVVKVEMHFLPDIYVPCDVCQGKRYGRETLEVRFKGKTIHDVLCLTVDEARAFFDAVPPVVRRLDTLVEVGLGYVTLGQSATTLSGGEAQRVKLALELSKRDTGRTLYILDEPTTGLHFQDVELLLKVLHRLRDRGNTVVVIEHNLDVIKTADWIIDLGPEGGQGGGSIVAEGPPARVAKQPESHTGRYLATHLNAERERSRADKPVRRKERQGATVKPR
ncbi:MAG: excinuclease ABC subunit UvrA [Betaproteobacteria bacterium]|nr:excinuclease ABC subunit UvrA [Betaproteobacteria bacterium]